MKGRSEQAGQRDPAPVAPVTLFPSSPSGVRVKLYVSPDLMPPEPTFEPLRRLAATAGIRDPIVALPDVHGKERNLVPTGIVLAARDHLFPGAMDKGINCGMRILATSIPASACGPERLDRLFGDLREHVPIVGSKTRALDKRQALEVLQRGAAWAVERFGLEEAERDAMECRGSLFDAAPPDSGQLLQALPSVAIKKARRGLGALGGGNHFLEAQEVVEVFDTDTARRLGIEKGALVFMLHTGSCSVSSHVMRQYAVHVRSRDRRSRLAEAWERWRFHARVEGYSPRSVAATWPEVFAGSPFYGLEAASPLGMRFLQGIHAAANFGFVNRMAITEALRHCLQKHFGSPDGSARLVVDCSHVTIQREEHQGESLWIHRHGSNVARPPSRCSDHPVWRFTGQPIPVPGSMGDDSYIAVGVEGNAATYHSANHGAGRVLDKPQAVARWSDDDVERDMERRQIRLFRGGTMRIAEQAPGSFKNVSAVMAAMQQFRIAAPVARTRPLAVLKG